MMEPLTEKECLSDNQATEESLSNSFCSDVKVVRSTSRLSRDGSKIYRKCVDRRREMTGREMTGREMTGREMTGREMTGRECGQGFSLVNSA